MAFVFLGANIGLNTPQREKTFCLQESKESKTRIRGENVKNNKLSGEKIKAEAGDAMTSRRCEFDTNTASIHSKTFPGALLDGPDYRCGKQTMQVKTGRFEGTQRRERKPLQYQTSAFCVQEAVPTIRRDTHVCVRATREQGGRQIACIEGEAHSEKTRCTEWKG